MRALLRYAVFSALGFAACDYGSSSHGSDAATEPVAGASPSAGVGGAPAGGAGGAGGTPSGGVATAGSLAAAPSGGVSGLAGAPSGGAGAPNAAGAGLGGGGWSGAPDSELGGGGSPPGGAAGTSSGGQSAAGGPPSGGQGGAVSFPPLRITSDTKSIEFTPALVAAEDFYPGEATVKSGGIVGLLSDTNVDLGTNAETQTLRQSVQYPNLRIIFTVTETFYRIVANRSAGIETLGDLRGKRIGSISNTSAAYFIYKYLGTVNLTPSDYEVVSGGICMAEPCGASTLPGMLKSGSVDAVALWEPSTELALQAIGENAVVFQDRALYREIVNLHSTTEKLADPEKRRGIVEFVRALAKAQALYRTEPEKVWPRITQAIGIEQPVLEAVWHDEQFLGTLVPDILDVLEEEEPWVAQQTSRTARTRAELATLVDDSILMEALGVP